MCGIIGYVGQQHAGPIVIEGLRRLEYRGYDSAGLALLGDEGAMYVHRVAGSPGKLAARVEGQMPAAGTGIGHTRWATHGAPTETNAHPHTDPSGRVAIVHNGIIENFEPLRREIIERGGNILSDTDTEVLAHLIAEAMATAPTLADAVAAAVTRTKGAFSVVAMSIETPGLLVGVRVGNAGGIVIGKGAGEWVVASDLAAVLPHSREIAFLEPGELVELRAGDIRFRRLNGEPIEKDFELQSYDPVAAVKGRFKHFMLKEIHDQPDAVLDAIRGRYHAGADPSIGMDDLQLDPDRIAALRRVVLVGMGTSMHSAMIGRHYIERFARLPAEADNSSEFRYRRPVLDEQTLVISIAQSGETVDTLAAMDEATRSGCLQITICNTPGAQTTRVADHTLYMRCGPEIAVASTKTMLASLVCLHGIALTLGRMRGTLPPEVERQQVEAMLRLPAAIGETLQQAPAIAKVATRYAAAEDMLFLGRGLSYAAAMEGALKLKEVSYIHAEGYAAGEMKHGPIALIDEQTPTIALAVDPDVYEKMRSNVEQVRARRGPVIAIVDADDRALQDVADDVIAVPVVDPLLTPFTTLVATQLFAYYVALERGADIDQPRNLAKTVTVE